MTQHKSQTHPSLLPLSIEGVLPVAKGQFELDPAAEWDASRDCSTIRNAMTSLPNRCRHCGGPVAGVGANTCNCRGKIEQVRFVSNPRNALLELFRCRCQDISISAALTKFVEVMTNIGLAHGGDVSWIEEQTRGLLPCLKGAARKWIIGICPAPFPEVGVLPAWFTNKTGEIRDGELLR